MAKSIVRLECEADELRAELALQQQQARILAEERDEAREAFAIATSNCVDAQQRLREMEDHRDFAMSEMERLGGERDEAREAFAIAAGALVQAHVRLRLARDAVLRLRKQRAIARNFGDQMERERDEARTQYRTTELLGMELVKTIDQLKAEKAAIFAQLVSLQAGSRRATLDEIAESVREKYQPEHEGEGMENE
jgi:hypothetical protein